MATNFKAWLPQITRSETLSLFSSLEVIKGDSRVEAVSNTSTETLRVLGGDEKGSLESEAVKYGHESHGSLTRK
jgi:hypothetical protein